MYDIFARYMLIGGRIRYFVSYFDYKRFSISVLQVLAVKLGLLQHKPSSYIVHIHIARYVWVWSIMPT